MTTTLRLLRAALLLALPMVATVSPAQTPANWDAGRMQLTRAELEGLLKRFEQASSADAHSPEFRARARYEAALVRTRLREGDFQVGDQITLIVEGEPQLSDTFVVNSERALSLPAIGDIPLQGVLRSELQPHLTEQIRRFIKEPVVRARSSIRLLVSGEVGRPGYFVVDTEALLSDALMLSGGPSPRARLTGIRVERANQPIWEGSALQQAIAEGRTMDQLSLRAGDHIVVPAETSGRMGTMGRVMIATVPALTLILTTVRAVF